MTPDERHRLASDRFLDLAELDAAARAAALARLREEDPELAAAVAGLLAADAAPEGTLLDGPVARDVPAPTARATAGTADERGAVPAAPAAHPSAPEATSHPAAPPSELRGDRGYRLLREIGRGGMGTVWLAERADGDFRQRVAIKLLHGTRGDAGQLAARFRVERQILAALDHPYIARLLDGGTARDGTPFLVMEHVEGERIDAYCERLELPVPERLRLVLKVCAAVSAAHQKLVVHRDLKPANILVTADGTPKLLDFGIAKLLGPEAGELTVAETRAGSAPLTPRYASPEQVRGEPISTATDVYSLGVVLYELLSGRSPYRDESLAPHRLARAICEEEPAPPSTAVRARRSYAPTAEPDRWAVRALHRDIDAIVLEALRKRTAERYASVEALAVDLKAYLEGHPVTARRAGFGYRTARFVRRNRWAVAGSLLFVCTTAGFSLSLLTQLRETARQRDAVEEARRQAEEERDTARAVTEFIIGLFSASDPAEASRGGPSLRSVVEAGTEQLEDGLVDEPAVRSLLLSAMARVQANLGAHERARELLELAVRDSAAARAPDSEEHLEIQTRLGYVYGLLGRYEEGERLARGAVAALEAKPAPDYRRLARARYHLGTVLIGAGRFDEGAEVARASLADYHRSGAEPDREIVHLLSNLSWAEASMEEWDAALRSAQEANDMLERLGDASDYRRAALALQIAGINSEIGEWDAAESWSRRGLELVERALGPDAPRVSAARFQLAYALHHQGRLAEAEALHRRVLDDRRTSPDETPLMICQSLHGLARTLWWRGDLAAAEATLRAVLTCASEAGVDPGRSDLLNVKGDLAEVLGAQGRVEEGVPLAREALAGLEAADRRTIVPEARILLGELLSRREETRAEGVRLLEEGRLGAADLGRFGRRHVRRALVALADAASAGGETDAAWCLLEEARALESALAPGDPARGAVARRLAGLQAAAGASAAPAIRDCAAIEPRLRAPGTDPG